MRRLCKCDLHIVNHRMSEESVSSHTDAIHIGAKDIDGSRMTLPR